MSKKSDPENPVYGHLVWVPSSDPKKTRFLITLPEHLLPEVEGNLRNLALDKQEFESAMKSNVRIPPNRRNARPLRIVDVDRACVDCVPGHSGRLIVPHWRPQGRLFCALKPVLRRFSIVRP